MDTTTITFEAAELQASLTHSWETAESGHTIEAEALRKKLTKKYSAMNFMKTVFSDDTDEKLDNNDNKEGEAWKDMYIQFL